MIDILIVWLDHPEQMAYLSPVDEESVGDLHLIKDDSGRVIGFECLLYHLPPGTLAVEFETAALLRDTPPKA